MELRVDFKDNPVIIIIYCLNPSEQIYECLSSQLQSSPLQPGASAQDRYIKVMKWIQHTVSSISAHLSRLSIRRLQWIYWSATQKKKPMAASSIELQVITSVIILLAKYIMLQQSWKEFGPVEWSPCWQGCLEQNPKHKCIRTSTVFPWQRKHQLLLSVSNSNNFLFRPQKLL